MRWRRRLLGRDSPRSGEEPVGASSLPAAAARPAATPDPSTPFLIRIQHARPAGGRHRRRPSPDWAEALGGRTGGRRSAPCRPTRRWPTPIARRPQRPSRGKPTAQARPDRGKAGELRGAGAFAGPIGRPDARLARRGRFLTQPSLRPPRMELCAARGPDGGGGGGVWGGGGLSSAATWPARSPPTGSPPGPPVALLCRPGARTAPAGRAGARLNLPEVAGLHTCRPPDPGAGLPWRLLASTAGLGLPGKRGSSSVPAWSGGPSTSFPPARPLNNRPGPAGDPQAALAAHRTGSTALAADIDPARALPWPEPAAPGDTVWMARWTARAARQLHPVDLLILIRLRRLVLGGTGPLLAEPRRQLLARFVGAQRAGPGLEPFHPRPRRSPPRRRPDTRIRHHGRRRPTAPRPPRPAVYTRCTCWHGMPLAEAIAAPRWLLGRTVGRHVDPR